MKTRHSPVLPFPQNVKLTGGFSKAGNNFIRGSNIGDHRLKQWKTIQRVLLRETVQRKYNGVLKGKQLRKLSVIGNLNWEF